MFGLTAIAVGGQDHVHSTRDLTDKELNAICQMTVNYG